MRPGLRIAALVLLASGATVWAQTAKSDTDIQKEDIQAERLYQQQNFLGALPLFEDLHQQRPENNAFRERLAMTLLGKAGTEAPAEAAATRERATKLLLDAKAAGDNSNLLQTVLEELSSPGAPEPNKPESPGAEALRKAEAAFSSGDMEGAITYYKQAAEADPKMYDAPLFAGDAEYKLKHFDEAGRWYAKAIAIDPNRRGDAS